jgi:hypothetical protein
MTAPLARAKDADATATEARGHKPGPGLYVVDTTIRLHVVMGRVKDAKRISHPGGWRPDSLRFELWGKAAADDLITVNWKDGATTLGTTECRVPEITEKVDDYQPYPWMDQAQVSCDVKGDDFVYPKTGTYDAEIMYKTAEKSPVLLRKLAFTVRAYFNNDANRNDPTFQNAQFYVDHDYLLAQNDAYWEWRAGSLNIRSYTKQVGDFDRSQGGRIKCTINGQPALEGDLTIGGNETFSFRDGEHATQLGWYNLHGTLAAHRTSGKYKPGKYECKLTAKAKVLRTIRFQLDQNLAIVTSDEQNHKPGAFVSRTTYLPDVDVSGDEPFNKDAIEHQAFLGRAWLVGAPKLAAGGGSYQAPENITFPGLSATTDKKPDKSKAKKKHK